MASGTSIRKFVNDVKTGQTDVTKVLKKIFEKPGDLNTHQNFGDPDPAKNIHTPGVLDPLKDWAKAELKQAGLSDSAIQHVDKWPPQEKENLRVALVAAIEGPQNVDFSWELYDGSNSVNQINLPAAPGDIKITFRSPRKNVKVKSPFTVGDITVDV